jgi:hypothetical protein
MPYIPLLRSVGVGEKIMLPKKIPEMIRVPGTGLSGICLSTVLFHMPIHWDGKRTVLCPDPKPCELCETAERRSYYLLGFWNIDESERCWVQLTPKPSDSLLEKLQQLNRPMLGTSVKIGRNRKKPNAPIWCTVDPYANYTGKLLPMDDPQETMCRVFGSLDLARQLHVDV